MEQYLLDFRGPNGYPSRCQIQLFRQTSLVIATDIDQGTSVTNGCEIIASEVVRQYGVCPHRMLFIEQYRPDGPHRTTDLVRFTVTDDEHGAGQLRHPRWIHIPLAEFSRMVQLAQDVETM
jgi:hypothetical protein